MDYSDYLPTNLPDASTVSGSSVLGGIVGVLSLWHAIMPSMDEGLALVPHHTVFSPSPYCPVPIFWNIATAHFFEGHFLKFVIIAPLVFALARMLERLWAPQALAFHLGFTALFAGFVVFICELSIVYQTRSHKTFFSPVRGCVGLVVALAVGLRHAYPFEGLPLVPHAWGLQCQHLPFALAVIISAIGLMFPRAMPEWPFAPLALFFGWLHIRYFMWFPFATALGDHTPEFTFASLFPRSTRPLVSCVGSMAYGLGMLIAPGLVKLREADDTLGHAIMYDPVKASDTTNSAISMGSLGLQLPGPTNPGAVPATSQRDYDARRAKALQLLDDNINSLLAAKERLGASNEAAQENVARNDDVELAMQDKDL